MQFLKLLFVAVPAMIVLDFLWLGIIAREAYRRYLIPLGRFENESLVVNYPAAFFVYVLLAVGITAFVLPRVAPGDRTAGFVWGALFGLVVYGIYDFTNRAILSAWPLRLVVIDVLWGVFLVGIVSWLLVGVRQRFIL